MSTTVTTPAAPLMVSRERAADLLGICVAHVDKLLRAGELPYKKFGRRVLVPLSAVQQIAAACEAARQE